MMRQPFSLILTHSAFFMSMHTMKTYIIFIFHHEQCSTRYTRQRSEIITPVKNTKSPKSSTQPAPASRSMPCSQPKQNINPTQQAMLPKQNTLKLPQRNVGFINLGNTCYANSMLQALSILPELWNQFPSEIGSTPPLFKPVSNYHDMVKKTQNFN